MNSLSEDTIIALATPPGEGALGIIRLSGTKAIDIVNDLFSGKDLRRQKSHTLHFGRIKDQGETVDEVVVGLFRAPASYTGEDIVEISCHGSTYILNRVIGLCTKRRARMAKPGEFTQRAFLNGKLDLAQAEAVADLIASQTRAAHHAALYNLRGGFSGDLNKIREELIRFSALIELELDFSEEDVEFADRSQLYELVSAAKEDVQKLLDSFQLGNVIRQGVKVAIVGPPNAGKSTLLNALLNEERAIVSDIAGTTRDTVEETLNINGILFRLIDTAGIREHALDTIENIGIERSRKAIEAADVVIVLVAPENTAKHRLADDIRKPNAQYETMAHGLNDAITLLQKHDKAFLVVNKKDLLSDDEIKKVREEVPQAIFISAQNKDGISELRDILYEKAVGGTVSTEGTIVTNARHFAALQEVGESLRAIREGLDHGLTGDLLALDIRHCLHHLGEITGEITTEDKLDYIFSKFCIGK